MDPEQPPMMFQAILARPNAWGRLLNSTIWVLVLYLAGLTIAVELSTHTPAPARKPRRELTVTLLDAPKVARLRALGEIGGGTAGETLSDRSGARAPRPDGRAPEPAVHRRSKVRTRNKSLPQDHPRATVGVMVQPEPSSGGAPSPGTQRVNRGTTAGMPSSDPERGETASRGAIAGTGGAGVVGAGTGAGSGGSSAGAGAGARPGVASGDTEVLPFRDGMTRPTLLSKVDPEYTREARDANVSGLILTKCVITTAGALRRCRIVKGIPLMDQAVLSALSQWRYSPVLYQGKPVTVEYLIPVRLVRP